MSKNIIMNIPYDLEEKLIEQKEEDRKGKLAQEILDKIIKEEKGFNFTSENFYQMGTNDCIEISKEQYEYLKGIKGE